MNTKIVNYLVAEHIMGWKWITNSVSILLPEAWFNQEMKHSWVVEGKLNDRVEHMEGCFFYDSAANPPNRYPYIPNYFESVESDMMVLTKVRNEWGAQEREQFFSALHNILYGRLSRDEVADGWGTGLDLLMHYDVGDYAIAALTAKGVDYARTTI